MCRAWLRPTIGEFSARGAQLRCVPYAGPTEASEFPLLLRAPGFHNGPAFFFGRKRRAVPTALAELPGRRIDRHPVPGRPWHRRQHRKYRVMMIGGWLYPLHLAISPTGRFTTSRRIWRRTPDIAPRKLEFLEDMPGVLGPRAMAALAEIQNMLGLDYAGIDFGLNARRRSSAVRSQCHHDRAPARTGPPLGLPARGGPAGRRRGAQDAGGQSDAPLPQSSQRPDQTSAREPTIYWQPVQELETRKCSTA